MATEIIETIKPAGGGNFLTLNAWVATFATRNLVSFDEIRIAECFAGGNLVTPGSALTIPSGITTDANHFVQIRAGPGEHISGAPFTTAKPFAEWTAVGARLSVSVADLRVSGIQLTSTGGSGRVVIFNTDVPNGFYLVEECLFISEGVIGRGFPFVFLFNPGPTGGAGGNGANGKNLIINNIFFLATPDSLTEGAGVAVFPRGSQTKVDCFNNTFIGTPAGEGYFHMATTDAAVLNTDNNYARASAGTVYGTVTSKGANDMTDNAEATTPAFRNIPYDPGNFKNPTDVSSTFDVRLPVGSVLVDNGAELGVVGRDVSGVGR